MSKKKTPRYWGSNKGEVILAIVIAGKTLTTEQIVSNTRQSLLQVKTATRELYQLRDLTFDYDDFTFRVESELYRDYSTFIFRKSKSKDNGVERITEREPLTSKLEEVKKKKKQRNLSYREKQLYAPSKDKGITKGFCRNHDCNKRVTSHSGAHTGLCRRCWLEMTRTKPKREAFRRGEWRW